MRLSKVTVLDGALDLILSGCLGLCSLRMDYCEFRDSKLLIRRPNLRLEHLNIPTFDWSISTSRSAEGCKRSSFVPTISLRLSYRAKVIKLGRTNTNSNLRQLRLRFSHTAYTTMLVVIIPILRSCPLLLEFHLDTESVESDGPEAMRPETAETHSQLKKVEITGFCGSRNEIEFALYVLENTSCLEQMQISRCPKWHSDTGFDKPRWSQQTRESMCRQLQGRALSGTTRVIIRHFPAYDDTWSTRETDYDGHCIC
ncbi:Unknown protein [Striga hermonthica]|uniref:FBD domain-containing protein n=1 Tax=Striga hermonthica TaxID=68872 RepID=A0A9N7MP50_STRHE|nr:Unknown protein [Striga hermonthica]